MTAVPWRLIVRDEDGSAVDQVPIAFPGARNMAFDQTLLESVAAGATPVLRLYRWQPGASSPELTDVDLGGKLRASTAPTADGTIFGVTFEPWADQPEGLTYSPASDNLWCVTERAGARAVFAVKRSNV